ncbi:hypothetical protein WSM22_16590 [Cytophagales bacterium WSM2-2]|nr:hypothetical protein WSM22_16590 [Cytophagales bacterium WSM2-2]
MRGLLLLVVFVVASCSQNRVPHVYANAATQKIRTQQGFTYLNDQLFSGWVYQLFPNGDTLSLTPYFKGREEGSSKEWYANRQLKETRVYHEGKKEGEHLGWYENGYLRFIYNYQNDVYEGRVKEWGPNKLLYRDFNYVKGYEYGLQRMWETDGRLKANYEVRNGRKYGLTGSKNCVSTSQ